MSVMDPGARELARELARLDRRMTSMERTDQLSNSSIEGGSIPAYDPQGNPTMVIGQQYDGTNGAVVVTGPVPPTPARPIVETDVPGTLTVRWSGAFEGGAVAPMDFARASLYMAPDGGSMDLAQPITSITSASGGSVSLALPQQTFTFALVAWTTAGKFSGFSGRVSAQALSTPTSEDIEAIQQQVQGVEAYAQEVAALLNTQAEAIVGVGSAIDGLAAYVGVTFRQPTKPMQADFSRAFTDNDIWFDTDDGNHMYVWNAVAGDWVDAQDANIEQAAQDAAAALAAAQEAAQGVADAIEAAGNAAEAAQAANAAALLATEAAEVATDAVRTRNRIFRQPTEPTSTSDDPLTVNDLWIDTDDLDHVPYRWDGTAWVDSDLPSVASVNAAVLAARQAAVQEALDADADVIEAAAQDAQEKATAAGQQAVQDAATAAAAAYDVSQGAVLQTTTQAQRGVKISSAGIVGWDSAGAPKFVLDASTGAVTLDGPVLTSAGITGSVVTGGTVQTESTANRGVKITSAGLVAYDAGGAATFTVLASTGAVTLKGDLTSGSTVSGATVVGSTIRTGEPGTGITIDPSGILAINEDGQQTLYLDAATGSLNIEGGSFTGSNLFVPFIYTNPQTDRGMRLSSSGLVAYADGSVPGVAAGTPTFVLNANTGAVTLRGDLTSGSSVTGAVVTGGTVQTSSGADTGVKITSAGIVAYGDEGEPKFTLTSETGDLTLVGGVLLSSSIYAPLIRTTGNGSGGERGVVISNSGLTAYNSTGTATVVLSASTGVLSVTGSVIAGGQVNGAVVTGGTVQTESTANRGVKITSAGLVAYDAGGAATFTVLASTGAVTLKGNLTSGSTITGAMLQTATSGDRIVIRSDGNAGVIESYIGVSGEVPGGLDPVAYSGSRPGIRLLAGTSSAYPNGTVLSLVPGGSGAATLADLALSDAGQFQVRIQEVTPFQVTRTQTDVRGDFNGTGSGRFNEVYNGGGSYRVPRMYWGNVVVNTNSNGDFIIGHNLQSTPVTVATGGNLEIITIGSADGGVFTGKARSAGGGGNIVGAVRIHFLCMI